MKFSIFQENIFAAIEQQSNNIVVNAVAGSGKTFTIVNACKRLHGYRQHDVLFLAFNRSIVDELNVKIGTMAEVRTCHSFGRQVLVKAFGRQPILDGEKWRTIATNRHPNTAPAVLTQALAIFDKCRLDLIKSTDRASIWAIADHHGIVVESDEVVDIVSDLLQFAYTAPADYRVDFTDMVVLAVTACRKYVPTYRLVFIDECQDLDTSKRTLMLLAARNGRFVAVGDPKQAINGFAGADCDSFGKLVSQPNTIELPLSVNYRCGSNIISEAQAIVPHITAHDGAIAGEVKHCTDFSTDLFPANAMVLCRKNSPLVSTALKLIGKGITAKVKGRDIAAGLTSLVKKLAGRSIKTIRAFDDKFDLYIERETRKVMTKKHITHAEAMETPTIVGIKDKVACIKAVMQFAEPATVADLLTAIESLFTDYKMDNCVTLSTIHKAKGLEADRVVILAPEKLPLVWKGQLDWQYQQEMNLRYVAITRAKKQLIWLDLDEDILLASKL